MSVRSPSARSSSARAAAPRATGACPAGTTPSPRSPSGPRRGPRARGAWRARAECGLAGSEPPRTCSLGSPSPRASEPIPRERSSLPSKPLRSALPPLMPHPTPSPRPLHRSSAAVPARHAHDPGPLAAFVLARFWPTSYLPVCPSVVDHPNSPQVGVGGQRQRAPRGERDRPARRPRLLRFPGAEPPAMRGTRPVTGCGPNERPIALPVALRSTRKRKRLGASVRRPRRRCPA